jgi:transcriptional regulator with XRE-family HTH domain
VDSSIVEKQKRAAEEPEKPIDDLSQHLGRRVKELRVQRGWSLERLAAASGVSRSMLSQIERDRANPTLAVTVRISNGFGISLGELLEMPTATPSLSVIRAGDRTYHFRSDKQIRIRTLSPLDLEKDVEFYEVSLKPGTELRSAPHFEGTREFLTVQKGQIKIESGSDSDRLEVGDSANYRADVPHAIVNVGKTEAVVFLVDIYG